MKIIQNILVAAAIIAIVIIFALYFVWLFAFLFAVFLITWACGMRITVKENDVPIGYIRWFTYHSMRK